MTVQALEFRDKHYFQEAIDDQDSLMLDIEIRRCIGINSASGYPGEPPSVLRNPIFTRAEVKPISLGEIETHGAINVVGDLSIRSGVELFGSQQKDWEYGDKINPKTVADIIIMETAPYQGSWYVVGVPEPGLLEGAQDPVFWRANIRRIRGGALGK